MNDIVKVQEPIDPAEAAFVRMQGELALLRRAIEALATERAALEVPDYSATLSQIAAGLKATAKEVSAMAHSPTWQLTPQAMASQIEVASTLARRSDHDALTRASATLTDTANKLRDWVESARLSSLQNWRLLQAGVAGLVGGAILCTAGPGLIASLAPESWGWPERLAAVSLGGDLWSAGERMLMVADPARHQGIVTAECLAKANRAVIDNCVAMAGKGSKPVRCMIVVGPDPAPPQAAPQDRAGEFNTKSVNSPSRVSRD